jgi:D-alanyl-D-alanine carboxypeptidase
MNQLKFHEIKNENSIIRERRSGFILLIILLLLLSRFSYPGSHEKKLDFSAAYDAINQYIKQFMEKNQTPGLAIAMTTRDKLLRVSTYGLADLKANIPVTPDTLFEIGSNTKAFTAIALMQKYDQEKFDPGQPVTRYLPWFKVKTSHAPITGHHLLTHTAGIPANRDDLPCSLYMVWALRQQTAIHPPGEKFYYSNIGYQTLSFILEELYGASYPRIIEKQIFEPLGMNSSEAEITHDNRKRLAVGYQYRYDDRPVHRSHSLAEAPWLEYDLGDGSIISNPEDMAIFLRMLLNRGKGPNGPLISEAQFRLFSSPKIQMGGKWYYGYGVVVASINGHTCLAHGGATVGYSSFVFCDLDDGLGVVIFVNGPANLFPMARYAMKALQAAGQGKKMPEIPEPEKPFMIENAADYAGIFTGNNNQKLILENENEKLILVHGGQRIALESRGRDTFYVNHPDFNRFLLRFTRDNKEVTEASYGSHWYTNQGYNGPNRFDIPPDWKAYPGHYRTQNLFFGNFKILIRKGKLYMITPDSTESQAGETELVEIQPGTFQIGLEKNPEVLRFDTIVQGRALRADYSGVHFYRIRLRQEQH